MAVRSYHTDRDFEQVFGLWRAALGSRWPVTRQLLARSISGHEPEQAGHHLVATAEDRVVGFVGAQLDRSEGEDHPAGTIPMLLVASRYQGRGIGTVLHDAALDRLRAAGARSIGLGGGHDYLWQGVPSDLPGALAFFRNRDWRFAHRSHDLTRDLGSYSTPAYIHERGRSAGVTTAVATASDVPALLEFEGREFPEWRSHYARVATLGDYDDLLVARDAGGKIVGSLITYGPWSHEERSDVRWRTLLGEDVGALGAVGVAGEHRGRGIGLGLVARGSEILKSRGAGLCFIGWVVLLEFYAKLGYSPWRSYEMAEPRP